MSGWVSIYVLACVPLLWETARILWPLRLNDSATHFTGLYRRYSVQTFTGTASQISTSVEETQSTGSGYSGHLSSSGFATLRSNRVAEYATHTHFFLDDGSGKVVPVDSANANPVLGAGHLASAAWLVHNGKLGNAFLVYNHTTGQVFVERGAWRSRGSARRGLARMVFVIWNKWVVALYIWMIATIPLLIFCAYGSAWKLRWFRNHGSRRLTKRLEEQAANVARPVAPAAH
jgi:hypothetical protein